MNVKYMTAEKAARKALYLKFLLNFMHVRTDSSSLLFLDNEAAIALTKTIRHHDRAKHIDIRFHFIRSLIEQRKLNLKHVSTKKNTADLLTKALANSQFRTLKTMLRMTTGEA